MRFSGIHNRRQEEALGGREKVCVTFFCVDKPPKERPLAGGTELSGLCEVHPKQIGCNMRLKQMINMNGEHRKCVRGIYFRSWKSNYTYA